MKELVAIFLVSWAVGITARGNYRADVINEQRSAGGEFSCDVGFHKIAQKCYKFHQVRRSWASARQVCQSEGGDLASVIQEAEYSGLLSHINMNYAGTYWISGKTESGRWVWKATGEQVGSRWWGKSPTTRNGYCTYFCSNTLKYWDKPCTKSLRFICEKEATFQRPPLGGVEPQ